MSKRKIIPVSAAFFLIVFPLFARDVTIQVEDVELGQPLEGAVIRSWDGSRYVCDEEGTAVVPVPDDRRVVIQASYPGYENARLLITAGTEKYSIGLRFSGIIESRELVVEAQRPGTNETKTGRSVAVDGRDISQTAEIGIIEDVMNTVKLLPGVGYAGFFDAQPSIRGGDPNDMHASLDGFYIMNPYHWGGGFSIFDPRMVQNAQLSHGVFSSRYGHSISGLLEVSARKPDPGETEFELSVSTSAANFNLSLPFSGKGGIMFMGRVTYYDPVIWAAKQMANSINELAVVNSVNVAPYIRSGAITGNYRFHNNLELQAAAFWGMDGVGVAFINEPVSTPELTSASDLIFDWTNYQGFLTAALSWNPRNDMLLKTSLGTGYEQSKVDGDMLFSVIDKKFSDKFMDDYGDILQDFSIFPISDYSYDFSSQDRYLEETLMVNVQGRADFDWELGSGLLAAAGIQEMFTNYSQKSDDSITYEDWFGNLSGKDKDRIIENFADMGFTPGNQYYNYLMNNLRVQYPSQYTAGTENMLFSTSAYALAEYNSPGRRFGAELGLRLDHFHLAGQGFSIPFKPALNPRLNVDCNVFKDIGIFQSFDLSAGTGLFSSINSIVALAEKRFNINEGKPNRSWTSVLGANIELSGGINVNVEGYYKYIFDRTYVPIEAGITEGMNPRPQLDGEGRVWGIDAMVRKFQSRYWDGWISYSYNWAQYRNPANSQSDWYFPSYHRFHNLNLVLNIKPTSRFHIYTRFGLASGVPLSKPAKDSIVSYPVYVYDPDPDTDGGYFIQKYYRLAERDPDNRTTPSLPMDVKFSIFGNNKKNGKTLWELYVAVESVLALLYTAQGNTGFNPYTGQETAGSASASYEMPIPIPSFGFKMSY